MKLYFGFKEKVNNKSQTKKKKKTFRKQCHIWPVDSSIDILISGERHWCDYQVAKKAHFRSVHEENRNPQSFRKLNFKTANPSCLVNPLFPKTVSVRRKEGMHLAQAEIKYENSTLIMPRTKTTAKQSSEWVRTPTVF